MKWLIPKYLQKGVSKRRSRGLLPAIMAATLMLFALVASHSQAEIGGRLYFMGTGTNIVKGDGSEDATPQLVWNQKSPNGKALSAVTSQPHALWLGQFSAADDGPPAINYIYSALIRNQVPTLVLYNLPHRDCGQASKGGAVDYAEYRNWIWNIAKSIETAVNKAAKVSKGKADQTVPIMIMLEPDSIGLIPTDDFNSPTNGKKCWTENERGRWPMFDPQERFAALNDAITTLTTGGFTAGGPGAFCNTATNPDGTTYVPFICPSFSSRVKVYLDGGNSGWQLKWVDEMAQRMVKAGIGKAQGFFTNSSNYQTTKDELDYGYLLNNTLSSLLSDDKTYDCGKGSFTCSPPLKTQVIDVSRNGNGPGVVTHTTAAGEAYQDNNWPYWCDNQQARLGQHPTLYADTYVAELATQGALSYIDGLLWLKPPGETDGCWGGPATAPNTQPVLATMFTDEIASDGTFNKAPYEAGWPSPSLACGLALGTYIHPYWSPGTSTAFCDSNPSVNPPRPSLVRVTHETRVKNGAPADTVMLEWEPSPGACRYQIGARADGAAMNALTITTEVFSGIGIPIVASNFVNSNFIGAPSTTFLVKPALKGKKVVYYVRAVACDGTHTSPWSLADFHAISYDW